MSDVGSHHDRYFRETFSRAEAARELVGSYLPPDVVGCLDLETLEVTGDSFVDGELRLHGSDLVCRVALLRRRRCDVTMSGLYSRYE